MVDKIFTINPEYTWDINSFVIDLVKIVWWDKEGAVEGSIDDKGEWECIRVATTGAFGLVGWDSKFTDWLLW